MERRTLAHIYVPMRDPLTGETIHRPATEADFLPPSAGCAMSAGHAGDHYIGTLTIHCDDAWKTARIATLEAEAAAHVARIAELGRQVAELTLSPDSVLTIGGVLRSWCDNISRDRGYHEAREDFERYAKACGGGDV